MSSKVSEGMKSTGCGSGGGGNAGGRNLELSPDPSGRVGPSVLFTRAVRESHDIRLAGGGGQGIERFFAPLRHETLMTQPDTKSEQLAGIGG